MPAVMQQARAKVLAACKANKIFFLNTVTPDTVVAMIQEGVMVGSGGQQAAEVGRKYTKREMPW
jgi:4-hydroxy-2-oxoheptanedioate aldolase